MTIERVNIAPEATPAETTEAHNAAMIAKADAAINATAPKSGEPERPAWLPEKFKDASELAKAYEELSKKLGAPKDAPVEAPKDTPKDPAAEAKKAVEDAGLDFSVLGQEIAKDGKLSEASTKALLAKGIPQDIIDAHVEGAKAQAELSLSKAHAAVGGTEAFQQMAEWAAVSASEADLKTYNDLVGTGDPGKIESAMKFLKSAYESANGTPATRKVQGEGNRGAGSDVYESRAQLTSDMKDPRYKTDPAFRSKVEAKVMRSSVL